MIQEALLKAAGPRTQTDIFVESWPETDNYIYQSSGSQAQALGNDLTKEWTQVFDLNDTALIVWVKNDLIMLKLMHLTEQPLNQFHKYIQNKYLSMPPEAAGAKGFTFMKTVEQEREILREMFDKYGSAKLRVNGQIIPNLVLHQTPDIQPGYRRFGFEIDQQRRTLSFLTTSNMLYQIDFDRYYLKKDESVFVKVQEFSELSGYVRAFDIVLDSVFNQYVFVVGTSRQVSAKDIDNQQTIKEIQDQTLTFIKYENGSLEPVYQTARQNDTSYFGFAKLIKRGVESILSRANTQIIGGQSKRVQPDIRQSQGNMGFEEGVVTLKSLTNGLIAAIYTSGILKVWSVISGICLHQHDLFESNEDQDLRLKSSFRLTEAKIQSITYPLITDTQSKIIKLALSYAKSSIKDYSRHWIVEQFNLNFTDLPTDQIDRVNENGADLSQMQHQLIPHLRHVLSKESEVQDLILENNQKQSHLWLLIQNKQDDTSNISDLLKPQEQVYTREAQESYYQLFDKVDLSYDLQTNPYSPYREHLQKHYYKRISLKGRFSTMTVKQQLQRLGFGDSDFNKYSNDQLLMRHCQESDVVALQQTLALMIQTELQNQKAYGLSKQLDDLPFRLVLRPVGISLLKIDSYFTSLTSRVNTLTTQLKDALKSQQLLDYNQEEQLDNRSNQQLFGENINKQDARFLELVTSTLGNPLLLLLSSMELLHLDVLPTLDKQIRSIDSNDNSTSNIKELIQKAMRESYRYEVLNNEILRIINSQRIEIEKQANMVIQTVVYNLLENNASDGKELDVSQLAEHNRDDCLYSTQLIRIIERGTNQEVQSLYQLLRDLLMLKTYINLNKPILGLPMQDVQLDQALQDSLIFWLRQLASLNWVMNQQLDLKVIQASKRLPLIQKLLDQPVQFKRDIFSQQQQYQYQQNQQKQVPLSLYMLTYIPQTYQHSPLAQSFNHHFDLSLFYNSSNQSQNDYYNAPLSNNQQRLGQVEPRSAMFPNILVNFIKKYMFKQDLQEQQTFIPAVIRKLYTLQQFNLIDKYLRPLSDLSTIALDFLRAIISVTHYNDSAQFLEYICSCLAKYHHCLNIGVKPQLLNLIIQKKRRVQISQKVGQVSENYITKFYLIILSQLEKFDERYSLFVINSALMEEGIPSINMSGQQQQANKLSDKDYLYNLMFQSATVQKSPDSLYTACTQISDKSRKRVLIGEFIHLILQSPESQHLLFSQYFFDQDQIDMGLDYLTQKVMDQLVQDKRRMLSKGQSDIKMSVTRLIRDIHIVSQLYDRQVEISRFLWYLASEIEHRIHDQFGGEQFASIHRDLLELKEYVLIILYQNAVYLGEHLFITDSSEIEEPSKKRKSDEISGSRAQQNQIERTSHLTSEQLIQKEGYGVLNYLNLQYISLKLNKGQMKLVTLEHIAQELYLTEGRIKVADFFNERDPEQVMKILIELQEYALAINIGLACNLEVAYPLAYFIQEIMNLENPESIQSQWQDNEYHLAEKVLVSKSGKSSKGEQLYQVQVSSQRFTLKIKQLISLAQGLVSIQQELPLSIEQAIVDQGHIKELVEFYLSDQFFNYGQVMTLLRRYLPRSIQDLVVSDIKLLGKILQDSEEFLSENQSGLVNLKQAVANQQRILDFSKNQARQQRLNMMQIRDTVLDDIDEFLGRDRIQAEKSDVISSHHPVLLEMLENKRGILKVQKEIENVEMGIKDIRQLLTEILNK